MKHLFHILLGMILLLGLGGCQKNSILVQMSQVDSLLNREQQDSAESMFRSIPSLSLSHEEQAYYNLLSTRILYRSDSILPDDRLIDYSISYYDDTNDKTKLADCYYYKGGIAFERGDAKTAVLYLKKAEYYAKDLEDKAIIHKIYEKLALINEFRSENDLFDDIAVRVPVFHF